MTVERTGMSPQAPVASAESPMTVTAWRGAVALPPPPLPRPQAAALVRAPGARTSTLPWEALARRLESAPQARGARWSVVFSHLASARDAGAASSGSAAQPVVAARPTGMPARHATARAVVARYGAAGLLDLVRHGPVRLDWPSPFDTSGMPLPVVWRYPSAVALHQAFGAPWFNKLPAVTALQVPQGWARFLAAVETQDAAVLRELALGRPLRSPKSRLPVVVLPAAQAALPRVRDLAWIGSQSRQFRHSAAWVLTVARLGRGLRAEMWPPGAAEVSKLVAPTGRSPLGVALAVRLFPYCLAGSPDGRASDGRAVVRRLLEDARERHGMRAMVAWFASRSGPGAPSDLGRPNALIRQVLVEMLREDPEAAAVLEAPPATARYCAADFRRAAETYLALPGAAATCPRPEVDPSVARGTKRQRVESP